MSKKNEGFLNYFFKGFVLIIEIYFPHWTVLNDTLRENCIPTKFQYLHTNFKIIQALYEIFIYIY